MSTKTTLSQSVGDTFTDWATRIYPSHWVVHKSTQYLRVLRVNLLRVIERIDDELRRREPE